MKYIKNFRIFEADEGTDNINSLPEDPQLDNQTQSVNKQAIEDSQKLLKEFQEKRSKMENIFKDPKITDDNTLDSTLMSQIYNSKKEAKLRNKWLVQFESVLKMERRKNALQNSINKDLDQIKKTNDDISRLSNEVTDASIVRKNQIVSMLEKNRKRLKELKDNVNSNKRLLSQDITNWKKRHEDFKRDVKVEEDRVKNLLSKI
jgi:hypothetical protein